MLDNKHRATRADVAREAGVSVTIVSYVLNNNRYVDADKRRRVEEAVKKLHYCPNNIARALKGKKSNQILFIADQITNEYFARMVSTIDRYACDRDFLISLAGNRNSMEFVSSIISRQYDGVVISSATFPMEFTQEFIKAGIPVIVFERSVEENIPDSVIRFDSGLYTGMRKNVRHLIEQGRKNIIYVDRISKNNRYSTLNDLRLRGYHDEIRDGLKNFREEFLIQNCRSNTELENKIHHILLEYPEIDGIVARYDQLAVVAMYTAIKTGKRVPQDIAVCGYDNSSLSEFCSPGLTTVEMDIEGISRKIVELIAEHKNEAYGERFSFLSKLIVRGSSTEIQIKQI